MLILQDELKDYVMQLSDAANLGRMPGEKAFLNALMDAVDDVPQVALRRSHDPVRGRRARVGPDAEAFRSYVAVRLERNGITVAVSEAPDFPKYSLEQLARGQLARRISTGLARTACRRGPRHARIATPNKADSAPTSATRSS